MCQRSRFIVFDSKMNQRLYFFRAVGKIQVHGQCVGGVSAEHNQSRDLPATQSGAKGFQCLRLRRRKRLYQ